MAENISQRIRSNPQVMTGKLVIRGTRIPVELIVQMLAQGIAEEEILGEYPHLQPEDIHAAVARSGRDKPKKPKGHR